MSLFQGRKWTARGALMMIAIVLAGCNAGTGGGTGNAANYPSKGRTVSLIVPYDAGGAGDVGARLLQPYLQDELGTTISIDNVPGAGSQIGLSTLARARPDGYTIGFTHLPATITTYLDPERQADFDRTSFMPVGMYVVDPNSFAVKGDSKYNSLADLIADAKARPGQVRVTDSGVLSDGHITELQLEKLAGVKFAIVHGDGGAANVTNILGDNTDVGNINISGNLPELVADGQLKLLAIFDSKRDTRFPDVATATAQGYPIISGSSRAISAPHGTPQEIVDKISTALDKAMKNPEFQRKAQTAGLRLTYMNQHELSDYWTNMENEVKPLIDQAR